MKSKIFCRLRISGKKTFSFLTTEILDHFSAFTENFVIFAKTVDVKVDSNCWEFTSIELTGR